jgi:hypothetical protein
MMCEPHCNDPLVKLSIFFSSSVFIADHWLSLIMRCWLNSLSTKSIISLAKSVMSESPRWNMTAFANTCMTSLWNSEVVVIVYL